MRDRFNLARKWIAEKLLMPLIHRIMPWDGWDYGILTNRTGYFWVVLTRQIPRAESTGLIDIVALQLGCDHVAQIWEFPGMDQQATENFITKLEKTQGVNNVCRLKVDNNRDFELLKGGLDKVKPMV